MKRFYVAAKGFIVKDGKILLLKKFNEDLWEAPGGRIDGNETITEALKRELSEEVQNITRLQIGSIIGAYRVPKDVDEDTSLILMYFLVEAKLDGESRLSHEHGAYTWADKNQTLALMNGKKDIIETLFKRLES